jgi:hypothetical protein
MGDAWRSWVILIYIGGLGRNYSNTASLLKYRIEQPRQFLLLSLRVKPLPERADQRRPNKGNSWRQDRQHNQQRAEAEAHCWILTVSRLGTELRIPADFTGLPGLWDVKGQI